MNKELEKLIEDEVVKYNADILIAKPSDYLDHALEKMKLTYLRNYKKELLKIKATADVIFKTNPNIHITPKTIMGAVFYLNQPELQIRRNIKDVADGFGMSARALGPAIKKIRKILEKED